MNKPLPKIVQSFIDELLTLVKFPVWPDVKHLTVKYAVETWPKAIRNSYKENPGLFRHIYVHVHDFKFKTPLPYAKSDMKDGVHLTDFIVGLPSAKGQEILRLADTLHHYEESRVDFELSLMNELKNCETIEDIVEKVPNLVIYTQWSKFVSHKQLNPSELHKKFDDLRNTKMSSRFTDEP